MPQTTDELRALMDKWFGSPVDDRGPTMFLLQHGWTEDHFMWLPPVPAHNPSREEFACLRFLHEEWDHDYELLTYYPETPSAALPNQDRSSTVEPAAHNGSDEGSNPSGPTIQCERIGCEREAVMPGIHTLPNGWEMWSDGDVLCDECSKAIHEALGKLP